MSLKERLLRYLQGKKDWIHSGHIQRLVAEKTSYTPQNVGRRLRELENDGSIEVKYERGSALYRAKPLTDWVAYNKEVLAMFDKV